MTDINERVTFLDKVHLFSGLGKDKLAGISKALEERSSPGGRLIIRKGDKADGFYMLYKGTVRVSIPDKETRKEKTLATLSPGDYFGEEALLENRKRNANITTLEDCELLYLSRDGFNKLIKQYEKLLPNFRVAIKSHKLARAVKFKWLGKNEVIYFVARRHKLRLYQALIGPVLSLIVPGLLLSLGFVSGAVTPIALGVITLTLALGWGIWNAIDWSNDYYIVTNQRVVWLEKVIGVHDSREEAPLATILSVGVETDMFGRVFDYGKVIVRTYVGKLEFDNVEHPVQAADMIREYWERTKALTTRSQMDIMKDTIKQKLGIPLGKREEPELSPLEVENNEEITNKPMWLLALQSLFKMRVEDGSKVIYRKHWFVLIREAWRPIGLFLLGSTIILHRIYTLATSPKDSFIQTNAAGTWSPDTVSVAVPILLLPVMFWLWYQYADWSNDVFMITNDQIFDIDKKPFGQEERRSAQIKEILSTSYKRTGIIAYIFNFGTVTITIGGSNLSFDDVTDPAMVQADINRRRATRLAKEAAEAGKEDRERFATWVAAYHQYQDEFIMPTDAAPLPQEVVERPAVQPAEVDEDDDIDAFDNIEEKEAEGWDVKYDASENYNMDDEYGDDDFYDDDDEEYDE